MLLVRQVLDYQIVDRDGEKVGKVDSIVIEPKPGEPWPVTAIECCNGTLARQLPWPIPVVRRLVARALLGAEATEGPLIIPWASIQHFDVAVRTSISRENEPGWTQTSKSIWTRWVKPIPASERQG